YVLSLILSYFVAYSVSCSFPTRRSSDLTNVVAAVSQVLLLVSARRIMVQRQKQNKAMWCVENEYTRIRGANCHLGRGDVIRRMRSEEHTSELQSRFDLVCRLLLEKKKKT